MDLVQSLDLMSDIHSTITTTSGCLFYQLVSFAFEVNLRKSVQISLIAVSGRGLSEEDAQDRSRWRRLTRHIDPTCVWKCTQGQIEAVPCEKAFSWFWVDVLLS